MKRKQIISMNQPERASSLKGIGPKTKPPLKTISWLFPPRELIAGIDATMEPDRMAASTTKALPLFFKKGIIVTAAIIIIINKRVRTISMADKLKVQYDDNS